MTLLTAKDLCLGFDGDVLVRDLNFTVSEGDYLCILGENGSGKSTLMRTLLGLVKPVSGTIEMAGGLTAADIGYLPQQNQVQLDFPASVSEVVCSGCRTKGGFHPFLRKQEKETARRNMEKMDILPLAGRCYRELSGGQKQRVLLARALCAADRLLLLDEPVSALDPAAAAELYRTVEKLNREDHMTIIMISHDVEGVLSYATHVLHIGDRVFFGTKEEYEHL